VPILQHEVAHCGIPALADEKRLCARLLGEPNHVAKVLLIVELTHVE